MPSANVVHVQKTVTCAIQQQTILLSLVMITKFYLTDKHFLARYHVHLIIFLILESVASESAVKP